MYIIWFKCEVNMSDDQRHLWISKCTKQTTFVQLKTIDCFFSVSGDNILEYNGHTINTTDVQR